jgi:hypothetical protein
VRIIDPRAFSLSLKEALFFRLSHKTKVKITRMKVPAYICFSSLTLLSVSFTLLNFFPTKKFSEKFLTTKIEEKILLINSVKWRMHLPASISKYKYKLYSEFQ